MRMNKRFSFEEFLLINKRLIRVPRCGCCKKRLYPLVREDALNHGTVCLCDACMSEWQRAKAKMCPGCGMTAGSCTCITAGTLRPQGRIPSVFFYNPADNISKVIHTVKGKRDEELFVFMAKEIAPSLLSFLSEREVNIDDIIFTWIPRSKRSIIKHGLDQGKELCFALSKELGADIAPLFLRKSGKEQKKLGKRERAENIKRSVFLNIKLKGIKHKRDIESIQKLVFGKTVVIVDDVITTGATVSRGIKLLRSIGAEGVIAVSAARVLKKT